jgi:hypothetical protein
MANKPVIFISATSDLRSARDLVGKVLYSMGFEPVWQEIAATDGGELLDVLRKRLEPAALVIQLVGQRYGAEPPQPTADFGRVSYTQFEALEAERLGKKVIYHFLDDHFPVDPAATEPPELASLQIAYRQRLKDTNRLRYDQITDSGQLELSIRRISDELAALRRQADRRQRNLVLLGVATAIGIAAVAALTFALFRETRSAATQTTDKLETAAKETAAKLDKQATVMVELRKALKDVAAAVSPKPLSAGQTQPDPIPPEILAQARLLLERGNEEQRALGMIALKQHEAADRLIQQLKRKSGNPIDEAIRLLSLEGDNWYQANEPDKALWPYEQTFALKPNNFEARNNLTIALIFARLGNVGAHLQRAIDIGEQTLKLVPPGSTDWAMTQNNLGIAWSDLPTGDKAENLKKAIGAYEAALTVRTKDACPAEWASTQNSLGSAWRNLPTGNKAENVKKAIDACEAALTVRTKDACPTGWAITQNNLGVAWRTLPSGNKAENLGMSIAACEAALTVNTKAAYPADWAMTQVNLGNTLRDFPTGDRAENGMKAIAAYEAALTVCTKDEYPADWAMTQNNLGIAWQSLPTGNKAANVKKAIAAYEAALTVYTKDAYPADWAMTQNNLGIAWRILPTGDKAENGKKAIAAYEAVLAVFTKDAQPADWARTQYHLGNAWSDLPTGDKAENGMKAIVAYEAALTVYTKDAYPDDWARTQNNLGIAWQSLPTGNRAENLKKAIAAYEAALTVYTTDAYPADWARTQNNLGTAWQSLPTGNKAENLKKAIAAYEAALTVCTKDACSADWARTQNNLGTAWQSLPTGNKAENLKKAIAAYEAALTVYTTDAYTDDWARTQRNLGVAWRNLPTGDKAENLKRAIAAYEAALSVYGAGAFPRSRLDVEANLSWVQLLAKDFAGALTTASRAAKEGIADLTLETNYAHALLLLGRMDEAQAIYLKHVGEKIEDTDKTWEQVVLQDFDDLEKNGVVSPEFAKLRELLKQAAEKKQLSGEPATAARAGQ